MSQLPANVSVRIRQTSDHYFTVRVNEDEITDLCWDEMLRVVIEATHPSIKKLPYLPQGSSSELFNLRLENRDLKEKLAASAPLAVPLEEKIPF